MNLKIKDAIYEIANETGLSMEEVSELKLYQGSGDSITLAEVLEKSTVYGFAEIQIDNAPLGAIEVAIELKQLGLENVSIFLCACHKTNDGPEDWFEDYRCVYVYMSSDLNAEDVRKKMQEVRPSYILTAEAIGE